MPRLTKPASIAGRQGTRGPAIAAQASRIGPGSRHCGAVRSCGIILRMGYYMRFFVEDGRPVTLDEVANGLRGIDPGFRLEADGNLHRADQLLGQLEINSADDELFSEEINEFLEMIEGAGSRGKEKIADRLKQVTATLSVQVLSQGRTFEQTLDLLDPLWNWLLEHRRGLVQADGEGFYDGRELVLALK